MQLPRATRTLRILFLYSRPVLPMRRADQMTVAHLLEFLHARGHEIDLVTLVPKGFRESPEQKTWLESRCRKIELIEHGRLAGLIEGTLGVLRGWPFQIGFLLSRRQLARAAALAADRHYDLAYAYYIRSAEALGSAVGRVPVTFLALQLAQTLNTARLSRIAASLPERLFFRFESWRMAAYEARIWRRFSRTVLIGNADVEAIRAACIRHGLPPIDNVVFGPHGVDTAAFARRDPSLVEPATVMMSGVMRYPPNIEAALWFVTEVWPLVRAVLPEARFVLVGRDPVPALEALDGKNGITVTGMVPSVADWLARATVVVAPIRAAAGLQNKLLEAMAAGRAVVATAVANEGIAAVPDRDLVIADTPRAMADAVLALIADPLRRARIGASARRLVEERWTWEGPFLDLERAFLAACEATLRRDGPARAATPLTGPLSVSPDASS